MKTLKKTLCLVLAVVMVVGVLILPASAATTTAAKDDDLEAKYNEALKVLGVTGIYQGDEGGLRANDPITRREVAVIVSRLVATDAFVKDYPAETVSFADCKTLDWGKEYIAYCEDNKIVSGDETGFRPDDNVTGYEFAKMLLVAIGFDPAESGFFGDKWTANVYTTVLKTKLNKDLGTINWNAPIKRGQVAQLTMNALTYTTEAGDVYTVLDADDHVVYHGDNYNKAMLLVQSTGYRVETTPSTAGSIADIVYNGLHRLPAGSVDAFGRPETVWKDNDGTVLELLEEPDAYFDGTFTGTAAKKYLKEINDEKNPKTISVYYNGSKNILTFDAVVDKNGNVTAPNGLWYSDNFAIRGYEVSIYNATDDMNVVTGYKVIVREAYVAAVGATAKDGTISLNVFEHSKFMENGANTGVAFNVINDDEEDDDIVYDILKTFKKDDIVGVYMAPGWDATAPDDEAILEVAPLEKKANQVITRIDDNMKKTLSYITVKETADATTETIYYINNEALCLIKDGDVIKFSNDVMGQGRRKLTVGAATLYLLNGNVLFVDQSKTEVVTKLTSGYGYCYDYKTLYNSDSVWQSEGGVTSTYISRARLLLPDGSDLDPEGVVLTEDCSETTLSVRPEDEPTLKRYDYLGFLVYYEKQSNNRYRLTVIKGNPLTSGADLEVKKGKSEGKIPAETGNTQVYFDSQTVFMVVETDNANRNYVKTKAFYTIYNIDTLPFAIDKADLVVAAAGLADNGALVEGGVVGTQKYANVVLIKNPKPAVTPVTVNDTYFILKSPNATLVKELKADGTEIRYYMYHAVVNNMLVDVKILDTARNAFFGEDTVVITHNPAKDADGLITARGDTQDVMTVMDVGDIKNDHVTLTDNASKTEDYLVSSAKDVVFVYSTKDWSIVSVSKDSIPAVNDYTGYVFRNRETGVIEVMFLTLDTQG